MALIISNLAYSSEIIVSKSIQVLAINGKEINESFLSKNKIEVEDGSQQIVVRYSHRFRNNDLLESKPYIFTIDVQGDTTLATDQFTTYAQAAANIKKQINWHINNQNKSYTLNNADQLQGKGFMPYRNIEQLIQEYNGTVNSAVPSESQLSLDGDQNAKDYLIKQYKAASQEQKDRFKMWFIQH